MTSFFSASNAERDREAREAEGAESSRGGTLPHKEAEDERADAEGKAYKLNVSYPANLGPKFVTMHNGRNKLYPQWKMPQC